MALHPIGHEAAGQVVVQGAIDHALPALAQSSGGDVVVQGGANHALPVFGQSAVGQVDIAGNANHALPVFSQDLEGTRVDFVMPTTNLTGHFDASVADDLWEDWGPPGGTQATDESSVERWDNKKSGATNALINTTDANEPTWQQTPRVMRHRNLEFTGTDFLQSRDNAGSAEASSVYLDADGWTIAIAFRAEAGAITSSASAGAAHQLIADGGGFWGLSLRKHGTGDFRANAYNYDNTTDVVELTGIQEGETHVIVMRLGGGSLYARLDGGSESSTTSADTLNLTNQFQVGASTSLGAIVRIGEIAIYDANLTGDDLTNLKGYFAEKWLGETTTLGDAVQTLPVFAQAATGNVEINCDIVQTLAQVQQSLTSQVIVAGAASHSLPTVAHAAAGQVIVQGDADHAFPVFAQSGTLQGVRNVDIDQTLPVFAQNATADVEINCDIIQTLPVVASRGVGQVDIGAAGNHAIPQFGQAGVGQVDVAGGINQTLPVFGQSVTTVGAVIGNITQTLPAFQQFATDFATGNADHSLPVFAQSGAGDVVVQGDIDQSVTAFAQSAAAKHVTDLAIDHALPVFAQYTIVNANVANIDQTLPSFAQAIFSPKPIEEGPPYLGGMEITATEWLSATSLRVTFTSTHTTLRHQVYAGRTLIGSTANADERQIIAHLQPSTWPQTIQLVAVSPTLTGSNWGRILPPRPYNRVSVSVFPSSWTDASHIDLIGGTEPGGAVDSSNLLAREPYDIGREYKIATKPLAGSGTWNFEVRGRDERVIGGNLGDALELSADVLAHPPDVTVNSDGTRFNVSIASQQATVSYATG